MSKKHVETVHFRIEGEYITQVYRTFVREGRWRHAYDNLPLDIIGLSQEQATMVLKGEAQFVGTNSVELMSDDIHADPDWEKQQYGIYIRDLIVLNNTIYRKYNTIESLNSQDAERARDMFDWEQVPFVSGKQSFTQDRIRTYMQDCFNDHYLPSTHGGWDLYQVATVDFPVWITTDMIKLMIIARQPVGIENHIDNHNALIEADHQNNQPSVDTSLVDNFLADVLAADKAVNDLDGIKARIQTQADTQGGWFTTTDKKTKRQYKIPKAPFLRWCLTNSPLYHTIDWTAICPRSMKASGDDPNHTDWWLFTGEDLCDGYNESNRTVKFFSDERHRMHKKYTNSNLKCLVDAKHAGFTDAQIVHINSYEDHVAIAELPDNAIVIVPTASPEYEPLAHKIAKQNSILITETGGGLCHLAIVGREMGLQLYLYPNARQLLPEGGYAHIDTHEHEIRIMDVSGSAQDDVIEAKLSGDYYR
jgi:hypothetical protein